MVTDIWNRYVESAAQRFGVPPALVSSVIGAESSGRPGVVSSAGAGGLMQLMPDTFAEVRRTHNLGPDRFDPQTNIEAGTAYLGQLYKQFGNWPDAISAYNAGPNRWRQVQAGGRAAPRETVDYTKKVLANFGPQTQEAEVPLFTGQRGKSLTGLLEVDEDKNFYEGLGLLGNVGQTPSQPPRTDPAAMPGTTQTDRLNVGGRINELIEQYLQRPEKAMPSQLQYMLAGAQRGVQGLAGVHDRRVGLGEMLGALGGGVTAGGLAYDEAAEQRRGGELERLLKAGVYSNQQRAADLNEQNSAYDNQYKQAMAIKALTRERDAKVVGKGVYVDGRWIQAPWANGSDGTGPLEGTGYDAQMTNVYVTLSQKAAGGQPLTAQETQMLQLAERHLMKPRVVAGPDGVVREVAPAPLPTIAPQGGGAVTQQPPPQQPAQVPAQVPPQVPPPNPQPRITEIVPPKPKEIPATVQTAMLGNVAALRKLSGAIDQLKKAPDATGYGPGLLNMLPGQTVNRVMPEGARARADLADIGSMVIHDRSGAAVTVGEMEKLKPFIPTIWDDEASVQMKIGRLQSEIEDILRDQSATYSSDQAYRENPVVSDVVKTLRPRAPMSGGEGDDPERRRLTSKYGLE